MYSKNQPGLGRKMELTAPVAKPAPLRAIVPAQPGYFVVTLGLEANDDPYLAYEPVIAWIVEATHDREIRGSFALPVSPSTSLGYNGAHVIRHPDGRAFVCDGAWFTADEDDQLLKYLVNELRAKQEERNAYEPRSVPA
jgi:hypothetical protein